jgi:peptidoglycan LD-endopeptidase CwlK
MSFKFGQKSKRCLTTCHPDLVKIAEELIKVMDVAVICGHRNKEDQEHAVKVGASKLHWPNSAHNKLPSMAMDIGPFRSGGIPWRDEHAFEEMRAQIYKIADKLKIKIKPLIVFRDGSKDLPHIELV